MRTALTTAVAAACLLPVAAAAPAGSATRPASAEAGNACDTRRVQTLTLTLPPKPPTAYKAGRGLPVKVNVKRGVLEAPEINVSIILRGKNWFGYGEAVTDAKGNATAVVKIPSHARGTGTLTADVYKFLIAIPCANIEEYDLEELTWGKAVK